MIVSKILRACGTSPPKKAIIRSLIKNLADLKMVDMGIDVDTSAADKMWRYPPA